MQVLFLAQVCSSYVPLISLPEHLYIYKKNPCNYIGITMKNMHHMSHLLYKISPGRVPVFHALQNFFLEEPYLLALVQEAIGQFVAARQLPGHPITVSPWDRKEDRWWDEL